MCGRVPPEPQPAMANALTSRQTGNARPVRLPSNGLLLRRREDRDRLAALDPDGELPVRNGRFRFCELAGPRVVDGDDAPRPIAKSEKITVRAFDVLIDDAPDLISTPRSAITRYFAMDFARSFLTVAALPLVIATWNRFFVGVLRYHDLHWSGGFLAVHRTAVGAHGPHDDDRAEAGRAEC